MAMTPPQPKSNSLITQLTELYANNFVTYYKSHGYHFNVEGPMFAQDHALLEEIYDFLWAQHDMLGEQIRQMDKGVPCSLKEILGMTEIVECDSAKKPSKEMFTWLNEDFDCLIEYAQQLYDDACNNYLKLTSDPKSTPNMREKACRKAHSIFLQIMALPIN